MQILLKRNAHYYRRRPRPGGRTPAESSGGDQVHDSGGARAFAYRIDSSTTGYLEV